MTGIHEMAERLADALDKRRRPEAEGLLDVNAGKVAAGGQRPKLA